MRARLIFLAVAFAWTTAAHAQTTGAWTTTVNPNSNLVVAAPGLQATSFKLQNTITNTAPHYVQDDTPANEGRYRARFYFNANNSDPGSASGVYRQRIVTVLDTTPSNVRLIEVSFRYNPAQTPQWGVIARFLRPDLGAGAVNVLGPALIVPTADNYVEIDWQRESTAGANDGQCQFWLNGVSVGTVTGVGLSTYGIDTVRMGSLSPYMAASAPFYTDEFESRRQTYIGALP